MRMLQPLLAVSIPSPRASSSSRSWYPPARTNFNIHHSSPGNTSTEKLGTWISCMPNSLSQPNACGRSRDWPSVAMPAGIVTCRGFGAGRGSAKVPPCGNFSLHRQIVQQIGQRLRVHQPVFDRHMQQCSVGNLRSRRFAARSAPRRRFVRAPRELAGCIFPLGRCSANPRACRSAALRRPDRSRMRKVCRKPRRCDWRPSAGANRFQSNASRWPR